MFTQEKAEAIVSVLPHGSGIDFDYEIEQKGKRIYIRNAWDYMDENGYYDDVFPFVVCYIYNSRNCSRGIALTFVTML